MALSFPKPAQLIQLPFKVQRLCAVFVFLAEQHEDGDLLPIANLDANAHGWLYVSERSHSNDVASSHGRTISLAISISRSL
jgi:hypothetical protein